MGPTTLIGVARFMILSSSAATGVDGIADHSAQLNGALNDLPDHTAALVDLRGEKGLSELRRAIRRERPNSVVVQYNPFSFSQKGLPAWLPRELADLRCRFPDVDVVLLAHELWLPLRMDRTLPVALAQRGILRAVATQVTQLLASTQSFADVLRRAAGGRDVTVLPVGSNLPDHRWKRLEKRTAMNVGDDDLVIAAFGTAHPSRQLAHVARAMQRVLEAHPTAVALNLGGGSPGLALGSGNADRLLAPGELSAADLADALAATDLMLLPFVDGVSTRRTTLMSSLQHQIAVLGTHGIHTDQSLRAELREALLPASTSPDDYARAAVRLAKDGDNRRRAAAAGRALYAKSYRWNVIAEQFVAAVR